MEKSTYVKFGAEFFKVYQDLQIVEGREGSEIFSVFLKMVFDRTESDIEKYLSRYINDLCISKMLGKKSF